MDRYDIASGTKCSVRIACQWFEVKSRALPNHLAHSSRLITSAFAGAQNTVGSAGLDRLYCNGETRSESPVTTD